MYVLSTLVDSDCLLQHIVKVKVCVGGWGLGVTSRSTASVILGQYCLLWEWNHTEVTACDYTANLLTTRPPRASLNACQGSCHNR